MPDTWRRARHACGRRKPRATVAFFALCLLHFSTAEQSSGGETVCGDGDDAMSCGPLDGEEAKGIIQSHGDGSVTLRDQTYAGSEHSYRLRKIQRGAPLFVAMEQQTLPIPPEAQEVLRQNVYELSTGLVEDLLALAAAHQEEWFTVALDPPPAAHAASPEDLAHGNDNFDKAVNAYETTLLVYQGLWRIVRSRVPPGDAMLFSPYDQEAIAAGAGSVCASLADMHHHQFNTRPDAPLADDGAAAYRFLVQAESWSALSWAILGVSVEEDDDENGVEFSGREEVGHDAIVLGLRATMAFVQVRLGALLMDMFAAGYVLGPKPHTLTAPTVVEIREGDTPEHTMRLILQATERGLALYRQVAASDPKDGTLELEHDYRTDVADGHKYAGLAHFYLSDWRAAAEKLERSNGLHKEIFGWYEKAGREQDTVNLASGQLQTTQSLWESYLNQPGETEGAREAFRQHLLFRQYLERRGEFGRLLTNEEEEEEEEEYYAEAGIMDVLPQDADALRSYREMLDEYLKLLSELPPDGSYYEIGFDYEGGAASRVHHDKAYEGSLRASIGSLQLAQDQVWEARGELEMAIELLRDGINGDGGTYEAYGDDGELVEYPVQLELANALLNLAYAQMALKQWKSSYESFEEAMLLFASALEKGETPLGYADQDTKEENRASWGKSWSQFVGEKGGGEEALAEDDEAGRASSSIKLDNYLIAENITAY